MIFLDAMLAGTFLVGSLLTLVEGGTYAFVGAKLRRSRWHDAPLAWRLFAVWWLAIGANKILAALAGLGFAAGVVDFTTYLVVIHVNLLLLALSLFCLFSYLAFLFSGKEKRLLLVGIVYAVFWFALEWSLQLSHPIGVGVGAWRTFLVNETTSPPLLGLFNLGMLFLPQVVAALLYVGLLRRVAERTQRYRIALVSASIIGWSLSITLIALPGFSESGAMQVGSRVVGVLAGIATLMAYRPPTWIREKFDVETVRQVGLSPTSRSES